MDLPAPSKPHSGEGGPTLKRKASPVESAAPVAVKAKRDIRYASFEGGDEVQVEIKEDTGQSTGAGPARHNRAWTAEDYKTLSNLLLEHPNSPPLSPADVDGMLIQIGKKRDQLASAIVDSLVNIKPVVTASPSASHSQQQPTAFNFAVRLYSDEERVLLARLGSEKEQRKSSLSWSAIARHFTDRTPDAVNRYYRRHKHELLPLLATADAAAVATHPAPAQAHVANPTSAAGPATAIANNQHNSSLPPQASPNQPPATVAPASLAAGSPLEAHLATDTRPADPAPTQRASPPTPSAAPVDDWTDIDKEILHGLVTTFNGDAKQASSEDWDEIGNALGRKPRACYAKWKRLSAGL